MKRIFCLGFLLSLSLSSAAQTGGERWLRDPAISPDGTALVFTHAGDIYRVDAVGGVAVPITRTEAVESSPRWSPDGSRVAYSSDRNGTLDVYLLTLEGGPAQRLTYHEADDVVTGFSADGGSVLFESARYDSPGHAADPHQRRTELYEVPVSGGTPRQITAIEARQARWNEGGDRILYADFKQDSFYRKHDDSPFARDVWSFDVDSGRHERLTSNPWNDHTPAWDAADRGFYFISERSGSLNVWHQSFDGGEESATQVTFHTRHPVRGLAVAGNGALAYGFDGEIYVVDADKNGAESEVAPVPIALLTQDTGDGIVEADIEGKITEFVLSPNDREIAFVLRGDVFVTSLEFAATRRITDTPGIERNLAFTPDGRGLLYAAERNAQWAVFESRLEDPGERYFYTATLVGELRLIDGATDRDDMRTAATHPHAAPDGRHVAYLQDWAEVRVFDRETGRSISVVPGEMNYSLGNDDIHFDWSPDSRFLAVDIQPGGRLFFRNVALVPSDGSAVPQDLTRSGYLDARPRWHADAGLIAWTTARYGPRQHGGHGALLDVHAQFLNQEAFDRFRRNKEEAALDEEAATEGDSDDETPGDEPPEPVAFEPAGAQERQARLTIHSSDLADFALTGDASKLYYVSAFEGGYDLWSHDFREEKTTKLTALDAKQASLAITSDDKTAVMLADGKLARISLEGDTPEAEPVEIDLAAAFDADAERRAMLHHVWLTTRDRIYDPAVLDEADWDGMYHHYRTKLSGIDNNVDFTELLNEFIGELDVSHAYARYVREASEPTGALGVVLDLADIEGGIRIASVLVQGPLAGASDRVAPGHRIVAVDGQTTGRDRNLFAHLRNRVGQRVRLTLADERGSYEVVLKPASMDEETQWRHELWVESRHQLVESLSAGRLGYVYIPEMSDSAYRRVYSDLFGRHFDKQGIVIDVRDNNGGDLVDWLVQLFTGRQYMWNVPDGRKAQGEPLTEWVKPSVALTNQAAYSDGHCFIAAWRNLDISTIVGTPVTGTCTYAGWETLVSGDIRAGTPRLGIKDPDGDWLERKTTYPDVTVYPDPNGIAAGEDRMLARAVEVLLAELDRDD